MTLFLCTDMRGFLSSDKKYIVNTEISCYEVDARQVLKPGAFMDMAQEVAYLAAESMSFGYNKLQAEGAAWVLYRMNYKIFNAPHWRDEIQIATWHKGPYGPLYLRDFTVKDNKDNVIIACTTSWAILNIKTRRMVRATEAVEMIPENTICRDNAIDNPAEKIILPKDIKPELIERHKVEYSDVDLLGHTNNARYVIWALDCLGYDYTGVHQLKEITVNFNHETRAGDIVELYRYDSGNKFYVEGVLEGHSAFVVRFDF